jgi:hypothetical protein
MPEAGDDATARAEAHMRWARRYSDDGNARKAAAHFGRALDYTAPRFGADHPSDSRIGTSRFIRAMDVKVLWPGKTIGDGLEVKESRIPGAGNGLFATTDFLRNDVITLYEGEWISRAKALRRPPTHSKTIFRDLVIDGLKVPEMGRGGGSFINDPQKKSMYNAELVPVDHPVIKKRMLFMDMGVYVRATKWIGPGDEIYVRYGRGGFKRAMRQSPVASTPRGATGP